MPRFGLSRAHLLTGRQSLTVTLATSTSDNKVVRHSGLGYVPASARWRGVSFLLPVLPERSEPGNMLHGPFLALYRGLSAIETRCYPCYPCYPRISSLQQMGGSVCLSLAMLSLVLFNGFEMSNMGNRVTEKRQDLSS
jgi:hypothetical protein